MNSQNKKKGLLGIFVPFEKPYLLSIFVNCMIGMVLISGTLGLILPFLILALIHAAAQPPANTKRGTFD